MENSRSDDDIRFENCESAKHDLMTPLVSPTRKRSSTANISLSLPEGLYGASMAGCLGDKRSRFHDNIDKVNISVDKNAKSERLKSSFNDSEVIFSERVRIVDQDNTDELKYKSQEQFSETSQLTSVLANLLLSTSLPKIEIDHFSGSPSEYVNFINAFETHIASRVKDPSERLAYLCSYCQGVAKEAIKHCALLPRHEGYETALRILQEEFGKPHQVIHEVTADLFDGEIILERDLEGLKKLLRKMKTCNLTLKQLGRHADLNSTINLVRLVKRLPRQIQSKWAEFAESTSSIGREPEFEDLIKLIEKRISVLNSDFGRLLHDTEPAKPTAFRSIHRVAAVETIRREDRSKCLLCNERHYLDQCEQFKNLSIPKRWDLLKLKRRCFRCLKDNHRSDDCRSKTVCRVNGCNKPHHFLLHSELLKQDDANHGHVCASTELNNTSVQLGFIPVKLTSQGRSIETYALLDNGSDCTLVSTEIGRILRLPKTPCDLLVSTLHGTKRTLCNKTELTIRAINRDFLINVGGALIVDRLPVACVNDNLKYDQWIHLQSVPILKLNDKRVGIVLGCDVPEVHWVLDQRLGTGKQPFAIESPLGWVLRGPTGGRRDSVTINVMSTEYVSTEELLVKLYDAEFEDVGNQEEKQMSINDERALAIVGDSARLINNHYELQVPWKFPPVTLPNNHRMAMKRLEYLKQKFLRNPILKDRYCGVMNGHIEKGYISLAVSECKRWFLPHHAVINPRKPEKLRVVFDCAACTDNMSLNKALLQGPDWTNSLTGVLLRFRRYPLAITADIKEMFLQVKLSERDRWAFSFLWWTDGDINGTPQVYQWNVHPFGATSSPFCANYALHRVAHDNSSQYSKSTVQAVLSDFYVDDYLGSVETEVEARLMIEELQSMLSLGGFELSKWNSNKQELLSSIPISHQSPITSLGSCRDGCLRMLGIQWNVRRDILTFEVDISKTLHSRRTLLSFIASVFDPLGLVSPVVLIGKQILRDLCLDKIGWDVTFTNDYVERCNNWLIAVKVLKDIEFARCIKAIDSEAVELELHIFSDASESGYGAAAYVRQSLPSGSWRCNLLLGKSRVAPLKVTTIPRLELTAALLAAKLSSFVIKESGLHFKRVVLWTDSAIVLHYLTNTSTRYATFVANRIRRIQYLTSHLQWRHVRSSNNPADLASRGISNNVEARMTEWMNGPRFLCDTESSSSVDSSALSVNLSEIEIKRTVGLSITNVSNDWFHDLCQRSPTWGHLLRSIAWLNRFKMYLSIMFGVRRDMVLQVSSLNIRELQEARTNVIRITQRLFFTMNSKIIKNKKVERYSPELSRLKPIEKNGVLYLGGRAGSSLMILPAKSRVTELLIQHFHIYDCHSGPSQVLAAIRRHYWIVHGMATVKFMLSRCARCRLLNAPSCQQSIAPLPTFRVEVGTYAFRYCGVDYFGPFHVKVGRSRCKRFGCLFTCMQARAIHIEVSHEMSTDSFLMCLMRFISRRGPPEVLFSDNGSNFVGAERELTRTIKAFDQRKITEGLEIHNIEWKFGPPYASHRGGVWERLIRSIRKVLNFTINHQLVSDEVLLTSLAEAERVVNDRPLIPVYDDPDNPTVLRPSDILLLRPCGTLINDDVPIRQTYARRWRQAQHLSDVFWKRWRREYLPTLQVTLKWNKSHRNLKPGDLVLITKYDTPRGHWPKGVVEMVYPGPDGKVRQVTVRTANGTMNRDIRSLCLLEGVDD